MRRLWLVGATALALAMSSSPAFGAVLWTLVGTPLTATTGQSTTFTLTATNENLLQDIRCIRVSLGSQFAIEATSVVSVSNGGAWTASATATNVTVSTSSGGDRLRFLQSLRFTVLARPLSAGAFAWNATAYEQEDCSQSLGLSLQLDAIVVTGVAPTSAPTQMATPTPTPRPTPTPTPAPLVPLPSLPLPTLPLPTLSPSLPLPTLSPVLPTATPGSPIWGFLPTPSPSLQMAVPTAQPSGSQAPSSTAAGAGGGGGPSAPDGSGVARKALVVPATGDAAPSELRVRTTAGTGETPLDIPLLGPLGVGQLWWVPAATIGGPGLLVVLFVGLQLAGGLAWLPATWRFRRTGRRPPWSVTSVAQTD